MKSLAWSRDTSLGRNGAKNSMDLSFLSSSLTIKAKNIKMRYGGSSQSETHRWPKRGKWMVLWSSWPWRVLIRYRRRFPLQALTFRSNNFPESQVEASSSTTKPTNKCASCSTPEADPEKPLKPCAKCQTVRYCSRDCQKKDFKVHKKICAAAAQIYAKNANLKPVAPRVPKKEGHRGGLQKWQFDTWLRSSLGVEMFRVTWRSEKCRQSGADWRDGEEY